MDGFVSKQLANRFSYRKKLKKIGRSWMTDKDSVVVDVAKDERKVMDKENNPKEIESISSKRPRESLSSTEPLSDVRTNKNAPAKEPHPVRGASPSLRSRISASPQSLHKFTENLRNSRLKGKTQKEEDIKRRRSGVGDSSTNILTVSGRSELGDIDKRRLPPPFTQPSPIASVVDKESETQSPCNTTNSPQSTSSTPSNSSGSLVSVGAMDCLFDDLMSSEDEGSAKKKIRPSETLRLSTFERLMAADFTEKDKFRESSSAGSNTASKSKSSPLEANGSAPTSPTPSFDISTPSTTSTTSTLELSKKVDKDLSIRTPPSDEKDPSESFASPVEKIQWLQLTPNSQRKPSATSIEPSFASPVEKVQGLRLTPNSHRKPSATSIEPSPRRVVNPHSLESPAKNTRSATKKRKSLTLLDSPKNASILSVVNNKNTEGDQLPVVTDVRCHEGLSPNLFSSTTTNHVHEALAEDSSRKKLSTSINDTEEIIKDLSQILGTSATGKSQSDAQSQTEGSSRRTSFRLTPNSHVKPTPTKIKPSPRRILNPKAIDSPAKNTRSGSAQRYSSGDTASIGMMMDLLRESSDTKKQTDDDEGSGNGSDTVSIDEPIKKTGSQQCPGRDEFASIHGISPIPKKQPVSILSSRKKQKRDPGNKKSSQRLVAFGSPEAAEYHIGSPSVSLTPMPSSKAKAMFSIPRDQQRMAKCFTDTSDPLGGRGDRTIEMEPNLSALVEKMQDSPALSPICNVSERDDTEDIRLASNSKLRIMDLNSNASTSSFLDMSSSSPHQAGETVELESMMDKVITNSAKLRSTTDNQNSGATALLSPLPSLPSPNSASDSFQTNFGNEKTVELESQIEGCLANALLANSPKASTDSRNSSSEIHDFLEGDGDLTKEKSDAAKTSTEKSKNFPLQVGAIHREADATVELEANVSQLLQHASKNATKLVEHNSQEGNGGPISPTNSIDMTDAQSIASMTSRSANCDPDMSMDIDCQKLDFESSDCKQDTDIDGQSEEDFEVTHTVELEADMVALLVAAGMKNANGADSNASIPEPQPDRNQSIIGDDMDIEESISGKSANSFGDSVTNQSRTESAERDGTSINYSATVRNDTDMAGGVDIPESHTESSPSLGGGTRNSPSSRRYSLAPESSVCLSVDGQISFKANVAVLDHTPIEQKQHSASGDEQPQVEVSDYHQELTLTRKEVTEAVGPIFSGLASSDSPQKSDALTRFSLSVREANNAIILKSVNQFIGAVCAEVEVRTDTETQLTQQFNSMKENGFHQLSSIQHSLRSDSVDSVNQEFTRLATSVKKSVISEWNEWLSTVLDSFHVPVNQVAKSIQGDAATVDMASNLILEAQDKLKMLSTKMLQRSRRKSLVRRKGISSALEDDIRRIRKDIETSQRTLEDKMTALTQIDEQLLRTQKRTSLELDHQRLLPLARSSQKSFLSLRGLHNWHPKSFKETSLSFKVDGVNPKMSMTLAFDMQSSMQTTSVPTFRQTVLHDKIETRKLHSSVQGFLDKSLSRLLRSIESSEPVSSSGIGPNLQRLAWALGRLDLTAIELHNLLRRYNAKLVSDETGSFTLVCNFSNRDSKVRASFDLTDSYPASPLAVELEVEQGNVDLDALHRHLVKNAKPGFGTLSRACDVVASHLS